MKLRPTRKVSEAEKAAISARMKGRRHGVGNKSRTGQKNSADSLRKIGDALRGRKFGEERKRNISLGQSKIPDEIVREVRSLYESGLLSQQKIADRLRIGQSHISRIIRRKCYAWVEG